jgi:hypothetical protein
VRRNARKRSGRAPDGSVPALDLTDLGSLDWHCPVWHEYCQFKPFK